MNFNIFSIIIRSVNRQIANIQKQFMRYTKLLSRPYMAINKFVKKCVSTITSAPSKQEDYIVFGENLYAKRLIFMVIVGGIIGGTTIVGYFYPLAEGVLWKPTISLNSTKFHKYSGKAKVVDSMRNVIYDGQIKSGVIQGEGIQYDSKGNVYYKGDFISGEYGGLGELYSDGKLVYKGQFSTSDFEGKGELYNEKGEVIFKGDFRNGVLNGIAVEYSPYKTYQGGYVNGLREGKGIEYQQDGVTILYEGGFSANMYSGEGKLYKDGKLIYVGSFSEGVFKGDGIMYNPENGIVVYKGTMSAGKPNGIGESFDEKTGKLIYSGAFLDGKPQGAGTIFDILGFASYTGEFKDGDINFKSYLGIDISTIKQSFGEPNIVLTQEDTQTLVYKQHKTAFILKDSKCSTMLLVPNGTTLDISPNMIQSDIHKIMGIPDFTLNYTVDYASAFKSLSIPLIDYIYGDKYIMDNYYIRIIYSKEGERVLAIEIGD